MKKSHALYGGAIKAHKVGSFLMGGEHFHLIRPGYCIQGKRRLGWSQVVHDDVPVFEVKLGQDARAAMTEFEAQFARHIGDNPELLAKALDACKKERRRKFRDGTSGEAPAPGLPEGRGEGRRYTA